MTLTEDERIRLEAACSELPFSNVPQHPDYVYNLLLTVLDLYLDRKIVNRAMDFYEANRWDEVRSLDDLEGTLARFPTDTDGNRAAAQYLWGYKYGQRLGRLRKLVAWARERGLTDQDALNTWASQSDFTRDFSGQVPGLAFSAYQWLTMRSGVETIKPDSETHKFVSDAIGRDLSDMEIVQVVTETAERVGRRPRELDRAIWESRQADT